MLAKAYVQAANPCTADTSWHGRNLQLAMLFTAVMLSLLTQQQSMKAMLLYSGSLLSIICLYAFRS